MSVVALSAAFSLYCPVSMIVEFILTLSGDGNFFESSYAKAEEYLLFL